MEPNKLFGKAIQILLIYFVTPSYQFVNENVKGDNKVLTRMLTQIPTKNLGRLVKPVTAQKLPVKASPIQITPQPLLTRRKVHLNPTESAKPQGLINNNKTPNSAKIDEPKPKQNLVENKDCTTNVNSEPETSKREKSMFSEETEDIYYKLEKDKVDELKPVTSDCKKEAHEEISETNVEEDPEEPENKEAAACKDVKTQTQEESVKSDITAQHVLSEDKLKDEDNVPIDVHEEYKIRSNRPKNCSLSGEIDLPEKKKVLKITDIPCHTNSHEEPKKDSASTNKYENSEKNILYQTKPHVTKLEINVSPQEMKKLTNNANDKIFIKKLDFEELHEKYDSDSHADNQKKQNDSPYVPDTTFIKEPYKYPLEGQIDIDELCEIPITNRRFPSVANKSLRERIWRAWKNSEIHIKSDNYNKNKRKNAKNAKNYKPNNNVDAKRYENFYTNVQYEPVNYGAYTSRADQGYKPNNVEDVICVDGNVEFDPVKYGTYKSPENQGNVVDAKRYVDDYSNVKIEPVVETKADQNNRISYIDDAPRFGNYNQAKFRPHSYGTYNSRQYGISPRNYEGVNRYFSGYGSASYEPIKYEPYSMMPQRNIWPGIAPAKAGIRYYSPNEYLSPPLPNCYYPQSYGNQYAPVSRYQKHIFPCM